MCSKRSAHGHAPLLISIIVPGVCFVTALVVAGLTAGLAREIAMLCASAAAGVLFQHFLRLLDNLLVKRPILGKTVQRALVIVLAGTCFFLGYQYYMRGQLLNALTQRPPYPRDDGMVADFTSAPGAPARNALGLQFSILSDSAWNKQSTLWYKPQNDLSSGDSTYLSIFYQLISTDDTEPYCGVYTDFSPPPPTSYDLSSFGHLSLRVRVASADALPRLSVVIYSANIHNYEYAFPACDIPTNDVTPEWVTVDIPLAAFQSPRHASYQVTLDTTQVYRIALILKGQPGTTTHGHVDVDEIRFLP